MEEDDGAPLEWTSPPIPKKVKLQSEECKELSNDHHHFEEGSKGIEDAYEDGPPPGWQKQPSPSPPSPLSDMVTPPPSSPLPPTPPLPSSPRDITMEQQESEDEGPPPGWDNKCQPNKQVEQLVTPPPILETPRDIKTEDEQQDAQNEDSLEQQPQAHPSPTSELVPLACENSDIKMEQQDSEDEGPPPGWDSKCEPEPELQTEHPTTTQSDIKAGDEKQDAQNGDGPEPRSQAHPSPTRELVPLELACENSDIKVEQQDSEDEGPPPGWDSKPELQTEHPATTQTDLKMEDEQQDTQDDEGPPPGWGSAPLLQSPVVPPGARTENEKMNVRVEGERPQPPSRPQSIPPTKPQILAPKPPMAVNKPEIGQMVCGSCRRLLSYPRGARYVECACCLEENYVLEEHEVGQVACGGCNVLLMYQYGAPKVRCANCSNETEIGDHNRRPPLSEQQKRARRHKVSQY